MIKWHGMHNIVKMKIKTEKEQKEKDKYLLIRDDRLKIMEYNEIKT